MHKTPTLTLHSNACREGSISLSLQTHTKFTVCETNNNPTLPALGVPDLQRGKSPFPLQQLGFHVASHHTEIPKLALPAWGSATQLGLGVGNLQRFIFVVSATPPLSVADKLWAILVERFGGCSPQGPKFF